MENKLPQSFRQFVKKSKRDSEVWAESMGRSFAQMTPRITQPMANLISLVYGTDLKVRALEWLMTEGLQQASLGRDKLAEIVNQKVRGNVGTIKLPVPPRNVLPTQKVAGIGEARDPFAYPGEDRFQADGDEIQPNDLFSPIAYHRNPALRTIRIDGLTIPEYYDKHFEPKEMTLEYKPGVPVKLDIAEMNHVLKAHGLTPFKYGGFDGYIQYVEKGDYLPEERQRSHASRNNQHGPDLRVDKNEPVSYAANGRPMYNFVGGAMAPETMRTKRAVRKMGNNFHRTMQKIETGSPVDGMDPQEVKVFHDLLLINKNLKKTEMGANDPGLGRGRPSARLFVMDSRDSSVAEIPVGVNEEDLEMFFSLIRRGLELPFTNRDPEQWKDIDKVFRQADGEGELPEGSYRIEHDGSLSFRLSKEQQEEIIDYIMAPIAEGHLNFKFSLKRFKTLTGGGRQGEIGPSKEVKVAVSTLFNDGVASNPALLSKFKRVFYTMKDRSEGGIDPRQYMHQMDFDKIEVNPLAQFDPYLDELLSKGYKWDGIQKPHDSKEWLNQGEAFLKNYNSTYKVEYDPASKKFFLLVPKDPVDKKEPFDPPTFGKAGEIWLGGDVDYPGGEGTGHLDLNPASPGNYDKLIMLLQAGHFGEPTEGVSSPLELPCLRKGVDRAIAKVQSFKGYLPVGFSQSDMWQTGLEALWAFAGDRAFQVGYITADEIERMLKWDLGKDQAISARLQGAGVTDPDEQEKYLVQAMEMFEKAPVVDLSSFPENVRKAIGENAYEARVRYISNYVQARLSKMKDQDKRQGGHRRFGQGADDQGKGGLGFDVTDRHKTGNLDRGDWTSDVQHVKPDQLRNLGGNKFGPQSQTTFGAPVTPKVTTQRPAVSQPHSKPKPSLQGLISAAKGKAVPTPQAPTTPAAVSQAPPTSQTPAAPLTKKLSQKFLALLRLGQSPTIAKPRPSVGHMLSLTNVREAVDRMTGFRDWLKVREGTYTVFDPKQKPKDGCGWNWEGAPGKIAVSIAGDADTAKTDPVGKKGRRGRK